MNSEDGQVYSVCILQFSCFTKYTLMQSKHKETKCKHSRRNSYRLQLSQEVSLYYIKELFKKTISNSSLNSHVYWDTLYLVFVQTNVLGKIRRKNTSEVSEVLLGIFFCKT